MYRTDDHSEARLSPAAGNLIAVLHDNRETAEARSSAAIRLGNVHDARVVPALEEVLRACVPGVWRSAAGALSGQGWKAPPGLDRLLLALWNHAWNEIGPAEIAAFPSLPFSLVEHLIQEDPGGAARVIKVLGQHGWKPHTPGEAAVYHILRNEWDKLTPTGEACLDPLVELAWTDSGWFDDQTRAAAARALEEVVGNICTSLPERTLRYLMGLSDPVRVQEEVGAEIKHSIYLWYAMRSRIQRELQCRGLWQC